MKAITSNGLESRAYLKKQIRDLSRDNLELKKAAKDHSVVINEHAKFINALLAQTKELTRRIEKLEYKKPKLIVS